MDFGQALYDLGQFEDQLIEYSGQQVSYGYEGVASAVQQVVDKDSLYSPISYNSNVISIPVNRQSPFDPVNGTPDFIFTAPSTGMDVSSLSIAFDQTMQQYYSYIVVIDGIEQPNNIYQQVSQASSAFDFVPEGKFIHLKPNARVRLFAYNSGGGSNNGTCSVYILGNKL